MEQREAFRVVEVDSPDGLVPTVEAYMQDVQVPVIEEEMTVEMERRPINLVK